MLSVESFKLDSIPVLQLALEPILNKAIQTPMPETNISDLERNLVQTNSFLVKLIHVCFDILGPHFVFNQSFAPLINPMVHWLLTTQVSQTLDKKNATKSVQCVKILLAVLRANTAGMPVERVKINMLFSSKRAKENWPQTPLDLDQTYTVLPMQTQDGVI